MAVCHGNYILTAILSAILWPSNVHLARWRGEHCVFHRLFAILWSLSCLCLPARRRHLVTAILWLPSCLCLLGPNRRKCVGHLVSVCIYPQLCVSHVVKAVLCVKLQLVTAIPLDLSDGPAIRHPVSVLARKALLDNVVPAVYPDINRPTRQLLHASVSKSIIL